MRRTITTLVTIILAITLFISNAIAGQMYVLCRPNDYVNARLYASTKAEVVGRLDCGDAVETEGEIKTDKQGRKWIKVYGFESGEAWICAMYLQDSNIEISRCCGYVVAKGRVALRRSPNGKRIRWLKNGAEVTILAMSDEWALTTLGYIKREWLDVTY